MLEKEEIFILAKEDISSETNIELTNELQEVKKELENSKKKVEELTKELQEVKKNSQADYSKELEQLIINQIKLNDYLIPTPEQIEKDKREQEKQQKIQEEELKVQEQLEQEQQQLEQEKELEQQKYQEQVLQELKHINDNTFNSEFQTKSINSHFYVLLLMLLLWFVSMFIYKLIKQFIH